MSDELSRRDWLKVVGAAGAASVVPGAAEALVPAPAPAVVPAAPNVNVTAQVAPSI